MWHDDRIVFWHWNEDALALRSNQVVIVSCVLLQGRPTFVCSCLSVSVSLHSRSVLYSVWLWNAWGNAEVFVYNDLTDKADVCFFILHFLCSGLDLVVSPTLHTAGWLMIIALPLFGCMTGQNIRIIWKRIVRPNSSTCHTVKARRHSRSSSKFSQKLANNRDIEAQSQTKKVTQIKKEEYWSEVALQRSECEVGVEKLEPFSCHINLSHAYLNGLMFVF